MTGKIQRDAINSSKFYPIKLLCCIVNIHNTGCLETNLGGFSCLNNFYVSFLLTLTIYINEACIAPTLTLKSDILYIAN